ncbi:MAG: PEFG-CTERM sorting domain-containing protein, partial [Nitrosopumilaceae archaeon]|nr:PEFG-CTERM sorting domain-containing protein [Nitrosopumilaceae archaeon]NIU88716.1 PEFG-CTERM sorting domain-containing protein [Nitrosopumilaceae archaeon]NIV64767.1 PEFG-CTERM sorting domain-containing protein [Nitrosopumilaceae archaeon]NIX60169.1 PEFG-CTERM sorting domain-containing protein [Nitrosopumilaceae archaeon]
LLQETKSAYRNGDSKRAFDLASEAYLDNYEFVEAPLGKLDRELMEKIEIDMRVTLRNMIQNEESPDKVDTHIDMILAD